MYAAAAEKTGYAHTATEGCCPSTKAAAGMKNSHAGTPPAGKKTAGTKKKPRKGGFERHYSGAVAQETLPGMMSSRMQESSSRS